MLDPVAARVAILSLAVQQALRVLAAPQAAQCAQALRERVAAMLAEGPALTPDADEAATGELAALLAALGQRPGV